MRRIAWAGVCLIALAAPDLARAQAVSLGQTAVTFGGAGAILNDGTETLSFAGNPAANSLVCVVLAAATLTASGLTGASGLGGTWTLVRLQTGSNAGSTSAYCTTNPNGSSAAVTFTSAVESSANIRGALLNFTQSGGAGFGSVTAHNNGSGGNAQTSPHSSGSTTPTDANNVCVGVLKGGTSTYTSPAGFTDVALIDNARGLVGYLIQTSASAAAYAPTTGAAVDRSVIIFCVDSPASGGGGPVMRGALIGVLP